MEKSVTEIDIKSKRQRKAGRGYYGGIFWGYNGSTSAALPGLYCIPGEREI